MEGTAISIPEYWQAWSINSSTGIASTVQVGSKIIDNSDKRSISYSGTWMNDTLSMMTSAIKDASFTVKFTGTQIGFYGLARPTGGYARVTISNSKGKTALASIVDMYCKYAERSLKFLSPMLKKDHYTIVISVMGEHGNWSDKKKNIYGSTGNAVSIDKLVIVE
jgi:hypothetical protein